MITFCILGIGPSELANFSFFLESVTDLEDKERRFTLAPEQISRINPNTRTAPVFRSRADATLTARLYDRAPVLIEERAGHPDGELNPWGITFQQGLFNMTAASDLFGTAPDLESAGFARTGSDWEHGDGRRFVPLYEAKMIHHYDHRWATYVGEDEEEGARDVTLAEKQDPGFEPTPRYWVPEEEVRLRAAHVPSRLKSAFRKEQAEGCLKVLAEWVLGTVPGLDPANPVRSVRAAEEALTATLGRRAIAADIIGRSMANWLGSVAARAREMQRETPLTAKDLVFVKEGPSNTLELTGALIDRLQPRWLMGFRDICRSTDERTVIPTILPLVGVGHTAPLILGTHDARISGALLTQLTSLTLDYVARQKVGGIHLTYTYLNQFPVLPPGTFDRADFDFITPRVIELTYTSHAMRPWAEDLGHTGAPFAFDPDRRALLRAELDAFFARKYGLTRDELRYILDPADVKGTDYPSETFRGLKANEMARHGEYRTRRLVLAAFDQLTGG
jgi:hypothetical protein